MEASVMQGMTSRWMRKKKNDADKVGLAVHDIQPEFIEVEAAGCRFQVSMPLSLDDPNSDSAFFATPLEDRSTEDLDALALLNDRLERVKTTPDCLDKILDNILHVFQKYQLSQPHVSRLVQDASVQCRKAAGLDGILPWCRVSVKRRLEAVDIEMDMRGIMGGHHVATALGFRFDEPLLVQLELGSRLLRAPEVSLNSFLNARFTVTQKSSTAGDIQRSVEEATKGLDEGVVESIVSIVKCFPSSKMRGYGPCVLVPQFINDFFSNCRTGPYGTNSNSDNIFIALSIFLGSQLKRLRSECVMCRKQLPAFSGLWFCDGDLCSHSIEELGIGGSVLRKLQNTEVVAFEITLAACATVSSRDVFEPYPDFLLKREEIRKRSGFFSEYTPDMSKTDTPRDKADKYLPNKDLNMLKQIIDSFPPLSEMQQCSDELELIVKLGVKWLQQHGSVDASETCQADYRRKLWLPYKVLSYVLFTNRSSLHPLRDHCKLNVGETLYQFAVIYDSEREQSFEERRKTEGSIFAFHGSKTSNWYSIIRNGLRCLSNTKYMNAMAYGAGIYLSPGMNVSLGYTGYISRLGSDRTNSLRVMALCEVFSRETKRYESARNILVVPPQKEKDVVIRYLIAFEDMPGSINVGKRVERGHLLLDRQSRSTDLLEHYSRCRSQFMEELENASLLPTEEHLDDFRKSRSAANTSL